MVLRALESKGDFWSVPEGVVAREPANGPQPEVFGRRFHVCSETREGFRVFTTLIDEAGRASLEAFICDRFKKVHGATLDNIMPELYSLTDVQDAPSAVVGVRPLGAEQSFLETYLDVSIDEVLAKVTGVKTERFRIAEVGNLAVEHLLDARKLISFLVLQLKSRGYRWGVCTGTDAVRVALKRAGVPFELIQEANPERLGSAQHRWGNYYSHSPFVMAIDLEQAWPKVIEHYKLKELY